MSSSLKYLRHMAWSITVLIAASAGLPVCAQTLDQFRLLGNHAGINSGFVTAITFASDRATATIDFLNVAGTSEQLTVQLSPSNAIQRDIPVFLPSADFLQPAPDSLNLTGIGFFHGTIPQSEGGVAPPHWFRLSHFEGRWSGVFRIDNRLYAIERHSPDTTVAVRPASQGDLLFRPHLRVRVSAVVDEEYVKADDMIGMENLGHLFALESVHILDGLLSDSLGVDMVVEQLIYQPSSALGSNLSTRSMLDGAEQWTEDNAEVFGLTDNLTTLFFRGNQPMPSAGDPYANSFNDHIAVMGNTPNYQFATAHVFGRMLELPYETNTLQHYRIERDQPLPDVLWNETQQQHFAANPLPASLVQIISYDAPEIPVLPHDEAPTELDESLLIAEREESTNLINEDDSPGPATDAMTGTGFFASASLILFALLRRWRWVIVRT